MTQLPARFANRTSRRSIADSVVTGLGTASPPYVSIKGGSFTLIDGNGEQEPIEDKFLDCVVIDTNALSRVFWGVDAQGRPMPYDPNADTYQAPQCFSDNGIGASRNAQSPQSASCQMCQWNVWGSAVSKLTGKPVKACSAMKKIAVLVEGWEFPFLLRVPVMSHENLRIYGDKFRGQEFDVSDVTTRITFVHGAVGQLDFQALGFTDDATEALVQKVLDAKMTDMLVGRGDVPIGELPAARMVQQIAAQPAPKPAAALASVLPETPPAKRGRKKAEPAPAAETARAPFATQASNGPVPPFLQRAASPAAAQHGIQTSAPAPNAELDAALASVFGIPTK